MAFTAFELYDWSLRDLQTWDSMVKPSHKFFLHIVTSNKIKKRLLLMSAALPSLGSIWGNIVFRLSVQNCDFKCKQISFSFITKKCEISHTSFPTNLHFSVKDICQFEFMNLYPHYTRIQAHIVILMYLDVCIIWRFSQRRLQKRLKRPKLQSYLFLCS